MGELHMTLKKNLFVALLAGCALAMTATNSFAWHHGGSCGSYGGGSWGGGWGSCGSYGGWGGYGSGGSCGSCGSCGSYGGGGYAYYGGYYGGGYASTRVIYDGVVSASPSTSVIASAPAVKPSLT